MNKDKFIQALKDSIRMNKDHLDRRNRDMSSQTKGQHEGSISAKEAILKTVENGDFDE